MRTRREKTRFAVGHMALGYVLGRASAKLLKSRVNLPLVLTLSVIPDIDILIPFLEHRGPTHSIVIAFVAFAPVLIIYNKSAVPYLLALIQHSLVGDYLMGGQVQLLWPTTPQHYGYEIGITSQTNIALEWIFFLMSTVIMLKTMDAATFFQPHNSNLILSIPTFTVLLPTFFSYPLGVPIWLIPPHLVYMVIFAASLVIDMSDILRKAR